MNDNKDDGTLAFLNIKKDTLIGVPRVKAKTLVNHKIKILSYEKNIKTKNGSQYVMHVEDLTKNKTVKTIISSQRIKDILDRIAELDAFPRTCTLIELDIDNGNTCFDLE